MTFLPATEDSCYTNMSANKQQIAKNAIYLYIRKGISIIIGLYTARLLLQRLGFDDYGLYGVVGSIVVMFNALRYIFTDSVQRYINVAKSNSDDYSVSEIFSIGINVHILLSIIFIIIVEVGGQFILYNLDYGQTPYWEVQILFQFSIFTAVTTFLTVPYDALIIANEKFNAYALLSIVDIVLRLIAVIVLSVFQSYRVLWYALIIFIVSIIVRVINVRYCKYKFKSEANYRRETRRELTIEMTKFAGWNFMGNFGYWVTFSGTDFILNHFGGLAINAARGITNQVFSNFQQFIGDLNTSFRPRSMMLYSEGNHDEYYNLMFLNTRVNFFICSILGISFIIFANIILKIWLSIVPPHTVIFCQIILLYSIVRSLRGPIDIYFKVKGNLKYYQLTEFFITVLNIPISWIALSNGAPLYSVFLIMAILECFNFISITCIATIFCDFRGLEYFNRVGSRILIMLIIVLAISWFTHNPVLDLSSDGLLILIQGIVPVITLIFLEFFVLFDSSERNRLISILFRKHNR